MRAILLAAGFGTRLRPLTNTIPKCLVPINGKPLLQIWLETLTAAGVTDFLINTHYLSKQVELFINKSPFKNKCTIVYEEELLGTAGTLLKNTNFINQDDCMLIHADNYCLANFKDFMNFHKQRPLNCLMTMLTFRTDTPSACGIVEIDEENIVIGFHEKITSPPGNLANGAVYIISTELVEMFKNKFNTVSDFSTEVLNKLIGKIFTYETNEVFIDIGTPESYILANSI